MISAILSKLLASIFKTVSYGRFLKLTVGCLDVGFCLLSGLSIIRLMMSASGIFIVNPSEKRMFLIFLLIRELVIIVLLCLVFEKPVTSGYKLDVYRCGAYLFTIIIYTLSKYGIQAGYPVMQAVLFQSSLVGFSYTLVLLSKRLSLWLH